MGEIKELVVVLHVGKTVEVLGIFEHLTQRVVALQDDAGAVQLVDIQDDAFTLAGADDSTAQNPLNAAGLRSSCLPFGQYAAALHATDARLDRLWKQAFAEQNA